MTARTRKLISAIALLIFLGAYVWAAVSIGAGRITLAPHWAQLGYFLIAGLLWVIPAGLLAAGCRDRIQPPQRKGGADQFQAISKVNGRPYLRGPRLLLKLTKSRLFSSVRAL